ncbi:MAG: hypothetical protein Q8908_10580, partial [Bacteroidota bacterium]|nr:hypothetical protein [Bacteroidota bacterium]
MEEGKTIRLSAAAREFNVGVTTILEYLTKKGVKIDSNPNSKLSADVYALLVKEYQKDKAVKQESEKKSLDISHRQSLSIDEKKIFVQEEEESAREDLLIKSNMEIEEKPRVKTQTPLTAPAPGTATKPVITEEAKPIEPTVPSPAATKVDIQKPEPEKKPVEPAIPTPAIIEKPQPEPVKAPAVSLTPAAEIAKPAEPVQPPTPVAEVKKAQEPVPVPPPSPVVTSAPVSQNIPEPAKVTEPISKPVEEKAQPVQKQVPVQETPKQPAETIQPEKEHLAPRPEQPTEKVQPKQQKETLQPETTEHTDSTIKVLGKMDLDAMNFKTKPERKSREEKK